MNQYFIDVSGYIQPEQRIAALNMIGYKCINDKNKSSIHFINLRRDFFDIKNDVKKACDEMDDCCILYTNNNVHMDAFVNSLFEEVVIIQTNGSVKCTECHQSENYHKMDCSHRFDK